jgi:hypothetical protein
VAVCIHSSSSQVGNRLPTAGRLSRSPGALYLILHHPFGFIQQAALHARFGHIFLSIYPTRKHLQLKKK